MVLLLLLQLLMMMVLVLFGVTNGIDAVFHICSLARLSYYFRSITACKPNIRKQNEWAYDAFGATSETKLFIHSFFAPTFPRIYFVNAASM